jgi:acyl-[acyl-carrier-protein]-phospholipid O-acyltransferase / long-chain-fatty-acid--[acyl-carrier-protein] ligase
MAKSSAAERTLRFFGLGFARLIYRVTATGQDRLPPGGFLLLPNHITWVDAIVLTLASPRPIRFIIDAAVYRNPILHPVLRAVGCIPITPRKAKDAMREAAAKIRAGEIVCLFPEGELSRSGSLLRLRRGYEIIARQAEAPVVPVWLDRLVAKIGPLPGHGRFRPAAAARSRRHRDGARGVAQDRRILLQPATGLARSSWPSLPARSETKAISNRDH